MRKDFIFLQLLHNNLLKFCHDDNTMFMNVIGMFISSQSYYWEPTYQAMQVHAMVERHLPVIKLSSATQRMLKHLDTLFQRRETIIRNKKLVKKDLHREITKVMILCINCCCLHYI